MCPCQRQLDLVLLTVNACGLLTATARGNITKKSLEPKFFTELSTIIPATPTTSRRTPPSRQSSGLASTSGSLARATLGTLRFGCGRRQLQCTSHLAKPTEHGMGTQLRLKMVGWDIAARRPWQAACFQNGGCLYDLSVDENETNDLFCLQIQRWWWW